MKAVIYVRVSQPRRQKMGLRFQRKVCLAIAHKLALKKRIIFKDSGISGYVPITERPGLSAAFQVLQEGDFLIVANRSRLARDPDLASSIEILLKEEKVALISAVGEGTELEGIASLKARREADVKAELFLEVVKQNTKEVLEEKSARGERSGTVPYGYKVARDGKSLIRCPCEQKIIKLVKGLKNKGHSFEMITILLNQKDYRSRTNNPFQRTQIVNILKKATNSASILPIDRRTPYGFKPAQHTNLLEKCPQEQKTITKVKELFAQGYSLRKVVNEINTQGYRSRAGTEFHLTQIVNILKPEPGKRIRISQNHELIKIVKELRSQNYTLNSIVNKVNQQGYRGTTGNPLQLTQVARILAKT